MTSPVLVPVRVLEDVVLEQQPVVLVLLAAVGALRYRAGPGVVGVPLAGPAGVPHLDGVFGVAPVPVPVVAVLALKVPLADVAGEAGHVVADELAVLERGRSSLGYIKFQVLLRILLHTSVAARPVSSPSMLSSSSMTSFLIP